MSEHNFLYDVYSRDNGCKHIARIMCNHAAETEEDCIRLVALVSKNVPLSDKAYARSVDGGMRVDIYDNGAQVLTLLVL